MSHNLLRRTVLYLFLAGFASGLFLLGPSPSVASDCGYFSGGPGRCLGCWDKEDALIGPTFAR